MRFSLRVFHLIPRILPIFGTYRTPEIGVYLGKTVLRILGIKVGGSETPRSLEILVDNIHQVLKSETES